MCLLNQFLYGYILQILDYSTYVCTGCLRNYRKLRLSVLGRLRELQYIFAVIYETLCIIKDLSRQINVLTHTIVRIFYDQ